MSKPHLSLCLDLVLWVFWFLARLPSRNSARGRNKKETIEIDAATPFCLSWSCAVKHSSLPWVLEAIQHFVNEGSQREKSRPSHWRTNFQKNCSFAVRPRRAALTAYTLSKRTSNWQMSRQLKSMLLTAYELSRVIEVGYLFRSHTYSFWATVRERSKRERCSSMSSTWCAVVFVDVGDFLFCFFTTRQNCVHRIIQWSIFHTHYSVEHAGLRARDDLIIITQRNDFIQNHSVDHVRSACLSWFQYNHSIE